MVVPLISKIVKPKGHEVANFEKTVAQVSFNIILVGVEIIKYQN